MVELAVFCIETSVEIFLRQRFASVAGYNVMIERLLEQKVFLLMLIGGLTLACHGQAKGMAAEGGQTESVRKAAPELDVLVFSKTAGYEHNSISNGKQMLLELADTYNFSVDTTRKAAVFTEGSLAQYDVVVFLNTTGDVLTETQENAFVQYIQNGGGFVGVHAATDTEREWEWYGKLVGTYQDGHSKPNLMATLEVADTSHLSTRHLSKTRQLEEEWYNFEEDPRDNGVQVLLTVDESTYEGGTMGAFHPVAWYHEYDGGRSWYTALGHSNDPQGLYTEPWFQKHVWGGLQWAADTLIATHAEGGQEPSAPTMFQLEENYPNPFNPSTQIPFKVAEPGQVRIVVYDVWGRQVAQPVNTFKTPGIYTAKWEAQGLPSGVYFYRMEAKGYRAAKQMILLK